MSDDSLIQFAQHVPLVSAVIVGGAFAVGIIVKTIKGIDTQIEDAVKKETESFRRDLEHHTKEEGIWQDSIVHRLDRKDEVLLRIEQRLDKLSARFTFAALRALGNDVPPSEE